MIGGSYPPKSQEQETGYFRGAINQSFVGFSDGGDVEVELHFSRDVFRLRHVASIGCYSRKA